MSTLRRYHWSGFLSALALCLVLSLPNVAAAETPTPFAQRSSSTPAPIDNLEDVQKAVVRIEAVGAFRDPAEEMMIGAGSGSGFIIDPEGYVVTNNHVVTGAALFKVYVDGKAQPVNARVLGVSECADLAVIDLQGKGYPYLTWYDKPLKVGLDVYAAGFPLGDPEYTLTRGIIAKARANGETSWASVDGVIQHDAIIDHGNSGGPLVTTAGQVVGVNYAGDRDANQFYAIGRDGALEVIEQLLQGKDVDSIGVNGSAVMNDDGSLYGIWVASVASGSPADSVGLKPGDLITALENVPVGEDGTMSTYCEILRSHSADDVMAIEVLRFDTEEVLEGQLNGRPLQQSVSLATDDSGAQQTGATTPASETYDEFVSVADAQGILTFDAPADWKDIQDGDWEFKDEVVGIRLDISPDLQNFYDDWSIPGAILRYSDVLPDQMAVTDLLDEYTLNKSCKKGERNTIELGDLAGAYQIWEKCGGGATVGAIVALAPTETQAFYVLLELYAAEDKDLNARDTILNTLTVTPPNSQQGGNQSAPVINKNSPLFDLVDTSDLAYTYVAIEDSAISALIPAEYSDIKSAVWTNDKGDPLGYILTAAPNIDKFNSTWTTPGVIVKSAIGMVEAIDPDELLTDETLAKTCTYDDRYTYTHKAFDRVYDITFDVYKECDNSESQYAVLIAQSDPVDQVIFIDFLAVTDADVEAFNTLLDSFYLDADLAGKVTTEINASGASQETGIVLVSHTDETGAISVQTPESWTDVVSEDWLIDGDPIGVSLSIAPDVQEFNDTWDTPGVFIGVSEQLANAFTVDEVLDVFDFTENCTYDARYDYKTSVLVGGYDVWTDCGDVKGSTFVVLAATPLDANAPMIVLYTLLPTEEDASVFGDLVNTLAIAGAVESAQAAAQAEVLSNPSAVVVVERLNVRSGPGTNFNRVGAVTQGEALIVTGQVNNCSWLKIATPAGVEGWVSGSSQYVTLDARCTDIPEVSAPAAPASGSASSGGASSGQASSGKANQGCYLFQNQIGPELTITFTNKDSGKSETFKVPGNGEVEKCFAPGRYTYTLDAPPPWGSTNGELTVEAGDAFLFPITPE